METKKTVYRLGGNTKVVFNTLSGLYEVMTNDHITGFYASLDNALIAVSY